MSSSAAAAAKYGRGKPFTHKDLAKVGRRRAKEILRRDEVGIRDAIQKALASEMLLTEKAGYLEPEGMEKTYKLTQDDLARHVSVDSAKKRFALTLDQGPYVLDYTRNGRHMLIGGRRGHVAAFDWQSGKLRCEVQLDDTVYDVAWLQNETMFAVAQKKYVYIYDQAGIELHRMKKHVGVRQLTFLPYHFLLVSSSTEGFLRYQDISTGSLAAEMPTKAGSSLCMKPNPRNAVMHLGHGSGTVTFWSPAMNQPLVKMFCHKGPVQALAVDPSGTYMATAGLDGLMKMWDLRTYRNLHQYHTVLAATALDISQRGLLAVGHGPHVTVWKDVFTGRQKAPYMSHLVPSECVGDLRFCPYEDILGLGLGSGVSSILIPGSGEPNYDSMEADPFATKKQRQEAEVRQLLDKLQPETIALDPDFVGQVGRSAAEAIAEEKAVEDAANGKPKKIKSRGRSTALRRYLRKRENVVDEHKMAERERERIKVIRQDAGASGENGGSHQPDAEDRPKGALDRFIRKSH